MKKIYIVLTYTGTVLSRVIRLYTGKKYSHVSISLDKDLTQMYSFGRINPYIPFWGGCVQESPSFGTFKRFKNTISKIYSLEVTDQEYLQIKEAILQVHQNRKQYRFNVLGLVAAMVNKKLNRDKCFYCAEFVKYVLDQSDLEIELPKVVKPEDFEMIQDLNIVYKGRLSEY